MTLHALRLDDIWNTAQTASSFQIGGNSFLSITSSGQTLISSISANIVLTTSITVNAGDYVRVTSYIFYETSGNEYDTELIILTQGPTTVSGYYDLV